MAAGLPFTAVPPLSAVLALLAAGLVSGLYFLYRTALPKPIPGIPYNKDAARSVLGDVSAMVTYQSETGQIFPWMVSQSVKLNSPIVQLFLRPFQKPWVIITDFRESQDILLRRTREFDRSDFLGDVFVSLVPEFHISKKSTDEKFKSNRNLIKDLMTPAFLHEETLQIYANVEKLIQLWKLKSDLAKGRPFSASRDIYNSSLDTIFATTFGLDVEQSTINAMLNMVVDFQEEINAATSEDIDEPVEFPFAALPAAFHAIITLTDTLEASIKSPIPKWHHWLMLSLPEYRKVIQYKEGLITEEIDKGVKRFLAGDRTKRSAMDDILQRELSAAEKEKRAPKYKSRAIYDELFGFLIAGYDTTSTTLTWGLKNLADNQGSQAKLRSHLHSAFDQAVVERRSPTVEEITKSQIPYLDAVIEEILRTAITFAGVVRHAVCDTVLLGHHIPKGTDIFLFHSGPDYFTPGFPIPEENRSASARSAKHVHGRWDSKDSGEFKPERWLVRDDDGKDTFNPNAGPHLAFGLGPRACYGKRLAYLSLRIVVVLLVWNFEFKECPESLSSYAAVDKMSRQARQCFVRLARAGFEEGTE